MSKKNQAQQLEQIPVSDLIPYARNSRTHSDEQVAQIAGSIREFGFTNPILIDASGTIIAGHGRVLAARKLAMASVPCLRLGHLTPAQVRAYVIADNRMALSAGWDEDMLRAEIAGLQADGFDIGQIGFTDEEIAALLSPPANEGETDPDDVPEPQEEAVSVLGDVWILEAHRLMCGNSEFLDQVERLMGGLKADMVFTDPPYNIASENKGVAADVSKAHKDLMGAEWDVDFCFQDVQGSILAAISENASVYVCTSHHLAGAIWEWMKSWSDHSNWCVWSKPNPMPSLMKRHWTWNGELICYATRGKHVFNFPKDGHALSIWTISKVNGSSGHPTEKPVSVPEHAILHSSKSGHVVLDLFGGSGSTLMACEKNGRACRVMEMSPVYCDVIVKRWQSFTGKQATLESTGETFNAIAAKRAK